MRAGGCWLLCHHGALVKSDSVHQSDIKRGSVGKINKEQWKSTSLNLYSCSKKAAEASTSVRICAVKASCVFWTSIQWVRLRSQQWGVWADSRAASTETRQPQRISIKAFLFDLTWLLQDISNTHTRDNSKWGGKSAVQIVFRIVFFFFIFSHKTKFKYYIPTYVKINHIFTHIRITRDQALTNISILLQQCNVPS